MKDTLELEFDAALAQAGITVEPERRAAMLEGYAGYRELAVLLDEEPPLEVEPAGLWVPSEGNGR